MIPVLLLALAGFASPGTAADAQLEVLEGRVSLAAVDGVFEVRSHQEPRMIRGAAYVEVPPLSRVSLRWHRAGSLMIEGPAAFEWSPSQDRIIWNFRQVGRTHMEIRSQRVRVYLPGGWIAAFENGASFLRERSGGGVEFHHDAGLPVLLSGPTKSGGARPPWTILAGAKLLLNPSGGRPAALRGTGGRMLEPYGRPEAYARERQAAGARWAGFSWPWRAQRDAPVAAHATASDRGLDAQLMRELELELGLPPGRISDGLRVESAARSEGSTLALPAPRLLSAPVTADPVPPDSALLESGRAADTSPVDAPQRGLGETHQNDPPAGSELAPGGQAPAGAQPTDAMRTGSAPLDSVPLGVEGAESETGEAGEMLQQSGGTAGAPGLATTPAPGTPWGDLDARIRRDGNLVLTPYGVRWGDWVPTASTTPQP